MAIILSIMHQTPGLRARNNQLEYACQRYVREGKVTELENLVAITKDLYQVDRHLLYSYLLTAKIEQDDAQAALNVWVTMQDEDLQADEEFLQKLGMFLKEKNVEPPFAVPGEKVAVTSQTAPPSPPPPAETTVPQPKLKKSSGNPQQSEAALPKPREKKSSTNSQQSEAALPKPREKKSSGNLHQQARHESSKLLESLLENKSLNEAVELFIETVSKKQTSFHLTVFKKMLDEVQQAGDVSTLNRIINTMENVSRNLNY